MSYPFADTDKKTPGTGGTEGGNYPFADAHIMPSAGENEAPNHRQVTLYDALGIPEPADFPEPTEDEDAYAWACARVIRDYCATNRTGTLEDALAWREVPRPNGVRLYVAHPAAIRHAKAQGWIVRTGGARPGFAPQAHGGLVRIFRAPRKGVPA